METPLIDALKAKYQALQADFGDKAAERLREVVDHALEQVTGTSHPRPSRSPAGGAKKSRTWTPAQRAEQKKKMQAYWAARRKADANKSK